MSISNPFFGAQAAAMYRRGRLKHHAQAITLIRDLVGKTRPARALDVGCGTGSSTVALDAIAEFVVGSDSAPPMTEIAAEDTGLSYVVALAERLPFPDGAFDAVTVASTLHWLDQPQFFAESRRVQRAGSWLAVYDHGLIGLEGEEGFLDWVKEVYFKRFPVPFHGKRFGPKSEVPAGYRRLGDRTYEDPRPMTREHLVQYHLSQSIVLAAIQARGDRMEDVRSWLDAELRGFVPDNTQRTARFFGAVSVLVAD